MSAGPLLGQGAEFARDLERARRLELAHAVVIEGAPGAGKSHAALELARALLCPVEGAEPCRACAVCRRVDTGNHPDLHRLEPPPEKVTIPVEQVRELEQRLARAPVEGRARVVVIDPADRLNEQGQNALLKTLEEPGRDTFLLLVSTRPEGLLETVRSRCARLRVRTLDEGRLREALAGGEIAAERVDRAVAIARGALGTARRLATDAAVEVDRAVAAFFATPADALDRVREILEGADGRPEAEDRASLSLLTVRERLRGELRSSLANGTTGTYVENCAGLWITALEAVFAAEQDLALGIGAAVVLEELFLKLEELLAAGPPSC